MQKSDAKIKPRRRHPVRAALIRAVLLLIVDRALKMTALMRLSKNHIHISGSLSLTYHLNRKLFLSLPGHGPWFNWLLIIIVISLTIYSRQAIKKQPSQINGWFLLLAGAYSNLYDRLAYGGVIDYFSGWFTVFNLADLLIGLGLVLVLWPQIRQYFTANPPAEDHSQPRPPEPPVSTSPDHD